MHEPIFSLLDTDLYKLTMMQCVFHQFPTTHVNYRFISRKPLDLTGMTPIIQKHISALCQLRFSEDELAYLNSLPYFKKDFINFLRTFKLEEKYIEISSSPDFELRIQGPWLHTILFEVPLLAIINESYYRHHFPHGTLEEGRARLDKKIDYLLQTNSELLFSDFGTRRRFSHDWQEEVIRKLSEKLPKQLVGTSNIYFAKKYRLKPIGTMAHEYLQAFQVLAPHLQGCQKYALEVWLKEYPHDLGIALTDTLTMDVFLKEFDKDLSNRFVGLRQDSGSPIEWGEKALAHYQKFNINAQEKTLVFSDRLTFETMVGIYNHFKNRTKLFFGIGTNLTNDMGHSTLDIVIKMTHANHRPVAKISDSKGKVVCEDETYLQDIKNIFNL